MTTLGDIIVGGSSGPGNPTRLPVSSNNQVLTVLAGIPGWAVINASNITTGTLPIAQLPTTGLKLDQFTSLITLDTDSPSITFNLATSNWHRVTLGGNRTLAVSGGTNGQEFTIVLDQDGVGGRTVSWFGGINWISGTTPYTWNGSRPYRYLQIQANSDRHILGMGGGGSKYACCRESGRNRTDFGFGECSCAWKWHNAFQVATVGTSGNVLTDNGSGSIPTFRVPAIGNTVAATLVTSPYAITSSFANIGLSVTLPVAGTYLLQGTVRQNITVSGSASAWLSVIAQFFDSTASAVVPNTESLISSTTVLASGVNYVFQGTIAMCSATYTVAGPSVINLQLYYLTAGSPTIAAAQIISNANGRTSMNAIRIS